MKKRKITIKKKKPNPKSKTKKINKSYIAKK